MQYHVKYLKYLARYIKLRKLKVFCYNVMIIRPVVDFLGRQGYAANNDLFE